MHNGAFVRLEDAIRHHLDAVASRATYYTTRPRRQTCRDRRARSSRCSRGSTRACAHPSPLTDAEFAELVDFVRNGLLDPAAAPERLRRLVPERLPSGRTPLRFEFP